MNHPHHIPARHLLAAALICAAGALLGRAGPLNPPAGPVSSSYKTLSEVEPRIAVNATNTPGDATSLFKITQSGSYYLTGNITGVSGKNGVGIAASGVTLDLSGFDLVGVAGSLDGVTVTSGATANVAVVNGSVRGWGGDGIDVDNAATVRLEGLLASGNSGAGIAAGVTATVSGCAANQNGAAGISVNLSATVTRCSARSNGTDGIRTHGFGCTIAQCTAESNAGSGINAGSDCTITGCTASSNTANGITTSFGTMITGCTASANTVDGIRVVNNCRVRANTCDQNGSGAGDGAGIHATNQDNQIEANMCTRNDRGIDVDFGGNFIARNVCSGNALNWEIAAANSLAPIVASSANANASAVSGSTYAGGLGSTDPNANFTY